MMKLDTARNIQLLKERVRDKIFTREQTAGFVSVQTLKKYDLIETVSEEKVLAEYTLDEFIETVNGWMGDDLYGMAPVWFERDGDKVLEKVRNYGYRFK